MQLIEPVSYLNIIPLVLRNVIKTVFTVKRQKHVFPTFHDACCDACRIEINYLSTFLSNENLILSIEHSAFPPFPILIE